MPSDLEKRAYTRVLQGVLDVAAAVFPRGTMGRSIDYLGRIAEYAITAAHCVDTIVDFSPYSILAGTYNLDDTGNPTVQRRVIQKAVIHPNYRAQGFVNDIALIQFAPLSTEPSSKISFICLPKSSEDIFKVNDSVIAIGWGVTRYNGGEIPKYLQQVSLKIFSSTSAECVRSSISDASVQFCAAVYGGGKGK